MLGSSRVAFVGFTMCDELLWMIHCSGQAPACNMQHATCTTTTCNMQRCSMRHDTVDVRRLAPDDRLQQARRPKGPSADYSTRRHTIRMRHR